MDKIKKIRQEIEQLKETHERNLDKPMERGRIGYAHGCVDCCDRVLSFIDSLSEETGEGLEKEIEHYYYDNFAFISSAHTPTMDIVSDIANHFYELGQRDAANKFDEIEYNRQRAGQEMLDKTLVVAAEESAISQYSMSEIDEELDVVHSRILHEIGFKAGAKWMAGQGVTLKVTDDTTWGEVNDFIHRNCDGVKEIQIRKKEESK